MKVALAYQVDVDAPANRVWDALVDWESQGQWMLNTVVWPVGAAEGVGARIEAFTGVVPDRRWLGFLDTMTITGWDPPHRCEVIHTGRVVRGTGAFAVESLDAERSRFHWSEEIELPWAVIGRIGWVVVGPIMGAGVRLSLKRFARYIESQDRV